MQKKLIDLSRILNNNTTVYPGTIPPEIYPYNTIEQDGFAEKSIRICSHFGTHIDAPSHILKDGKSLDQFHIDMFTGPALLCDVTKIKDISLDILEPFYEVLKEMDFIIFKTGWEEHWEVPEYFENFPVLTEQACLFLTQFNLKGIGFDAISVDKVENHQLTNHHILLKNEILIIENLCNLQALTTEVFDFQCFPLKIEDADGSPVRAVAFTS